ncbi:MAG: glycosyltransferase family 9 protein [Gemmatimonadaceae bacterium]
MRPISLDRVGVVMMSAVGDAVHVLPLLTALKKHSPASHVTWVLQPGAASLVRGHWAVDEIIPFDRAQGWRAYPAVRRALRARPLDVVLALQVYFKAGLVTSLARAPVKLGFDRARARDLNWLFTTDRIPAREGQHVQDQYLEFLDALGVPHGELVWDLGPWPDERAWQRGFLEKFERPIAPIVVATSKPEKDWAPERWAEVCDALWSEFGLQPVLVGGRSARELAAQSIILQRASAPVASALGSGLRNLVGILDGAALVLSPDTGPLHMAVALDRPAIALMGYTNPKRVGPYRRFHDLLIDAYGDPGENYPISMENRPGRMTRITVRDVLERVERWRASYAGESATSGPKS